MLSKRNSSSLSHADLLLVNLSIAKVYEVRCIFSPRNKDPFTHIIMACVYWCAICFYAGTHRYISSTVHTILTSKLAVYFSYISNLSILGMVFFFITQLYNHNENHFIYYVIAFRLLNLFSFGSVSFFIPFSVALYNLCRIWFNLNSKQGKKIFYLCACAHTVYRNSLTHVCVNIAMVLQWTKRFFFRKLYTENASNKKEFVPVERSCGINSIYEFFIIIFIMNGVE